MKKTKKKGFTLVELLVVIAILAILASVSVVGYTAFIDKANESNARTELTQIRDFINAKFLPSNAFEVETADGTYTITKNNGALQISKEGDANPVKEDVSAILHAIEDLASLDDNAKFSLSDDGKFLTYTLGKTQATWNVANGTITTSTLG